MGRLNEKGHEVLDTTPVVMPLGMKKPVDIQTMMQRQIIRALGEQQARSGYESFDEADDFDVEDEVELKSKYELQDVPEDEPVEKKVEKKEDKEGGKKAKAEDKAKDAGDGTGRAAGNPPGIGKRRKTDDGGGATDTSDGE